MLTPGYYLRWRLAHFDRVICWSGYLHHRLLETGVAEERLVTIPIGIDGSRFDLDERQDLRGSPLFFFAGLLSSLRGVPTLIQAFAEVLRSVPEARLIIADRGPHTPGDFPIHAREERRVSRMIADAQLAGSIVMKRFQDNLSTWFNTCDAVVLPFSTTIGYAQPPLTLLEAMAHEKPVISTRIGSVPEYVEDGVTGILTRPGDAEGLARAMIQFDHRAGREMGRTARRRIETLPGWDDVASMTDTVYADVVRSKGGGSTTY